MIDTLKEIFRNIDSILMNDGFNKESMAKAKNILAVFNDIFDELPPNVAEIYSEFLDAKEMNWQFFFLGMIMSKIAQYVSRNEYKFRLNKENKND